MMRIGVTCRIDDFGHTKINDEYIKYLESNDLSVVRLDFDDPSLDNSLAMCDAFIVSGGNDIDPALYGEDNISSKPYPRKVDELDRKIFAYAFSNNLKVLGICRGLQGLNVYLGGTLYQDIEDHLDCNHLVYFDDSYNEIIGFEKEFEVNSVHHQAIKDLAPNLKVLCKSNDGIIEAVFAYPALAVQWHPEKMDTLASKKIIEWLKG